MKVALVLERFDLQRGGAERSTYERACALAALGMDVTIVAGKVISPDKTNLPFGFKEVAFDGLGRAGQWRNWEKALGDYFEKNHCDIIHSMVPLALAHVFQPRGGSLLHSRRQHVASYRNGLAAGLKNLTACFNRGRQVRIEYERRWCSQANGSVLAALSDYVSRQFISLYGLDPGRVRLIPNGVNVEPLRSNDAQVKGKKLRALYDRDGKTALFLFVAANLRLKGLENVIRAASIAREKIRSEGKDFRILVTGSIDWGSYWKQANRLGLNQEVLFLSCTAEMPALYQMCDATVLPSYNDACSRVILESLAAGKPGITTRFNGAAERLGGGKYGQVLERCDDVVALAKAMVKFCDKDYCQTVSRQIEQDRLFEQVSMARHAEQLVSLYRELKSNLKT